MALGILLCHEAFAFQGAEQVEISSMNPFLGDGTHSEVDFFFADYLKANPGFKKKADELDKQQRKIDAHNRTAKQGEIMKDPMSGIVESELSHALGAIVGFNKALGGALYDLQGSKVALHGYQVRSTRMSAKLRQQIKIRKRTSGNDTATQCDAKALKRYSFRPY
jgi:hypothetical protein